MTLSAFEGWAAFGAFSTAVGDNLYRFWGLFFGPSRHPLSRNPLLNMNQPAQKPTTQTLKAPCTFNADPPFSQRRQGLTSPFLFAPKFNTAQHDATQRNATQRNTTQHNTTQHNATQHSTAEHNTTQHNAMQHITSHHDTTHQNTKLSSTVYSMSQIKATHLQQHMV